MAVSKPINYTQWSVSLQKGVVCPPETPLVRGFQAHSLHRCTLHRSLPTLLRVLLQPGCRRLVAPVLLASWHFSPAPESLTMSPTVLCTSSETVGGSPLLHLRLSLTGNVDSTAIRVFTSVGLVLGMLRLLTSELSRTPSSSSLLLKPSKFSNLSA